MLLNTQRVSR